MSRWSIPPERLAHFSLLWILMSAFLIICWISEGLVQGNKTSLIVNEGWEPVYFLSVGIIPVLTRPLFLKLRKLYFFFFRSQLSFFPSKFKEIIPSNLFVLSFWTRAPVTRFSSWSNPSSSEPWINVIWFSRQTILNGFSEIPFEHRHEARLHSRKSVS